MGHTGVPLPEVERSPALSLELIPHYTWCVQKVSDLNFSRINKAREVSIIVDVEETFIRMHEFFPAFRKRQSPAVRRWLCKCCERSSDCELLQNDGKTWAAVLHQILPKAWRYPSGNYSKDPTGFRGRWHEYHTNKSGTTASKMAAHQWTANHVTVGPQLAEMTMSSTRCGLCSCRTVVSLSENWQTRWG